MLTSICIFRAHHCCNLVLCAFGTYIEAFLNSNCSAIDKTGNSNEIDSIIVNKGAEHGNVVV